MTRSAKNPFFRISVSLLPSLGIPVLFSVLILLSFSSCSLRKIPYAEGCKIRTYINLGFREYVNTRFHKKQLKRVAVIPFDVPESFAPSGHESLHFGRQLARRFQLELLAMRELNIVEMLNRDRWPGKREDFLTGNYQAIDLARNAGYDFVVVGYMDEITNEKDLVIHTKIIDVSNSITAWHAQTTVVSESRAWRRELARLRVTKDRPEDFAFQERADEFARCTVAALYSDELE